MPFNENIVRTANAEWYLISSLPCDTQVADSFFWHTAIDGRCGKGDSLATQRITPVSDNG